MGLGGTAKKLQKVIDAAEQLYSKMNEVVEQLKGLRNQVETTGERVERLERDLAEQRVLLEALAQAEDIDIEGTLAAADLPDPDTGAGNGDDDTGGSDGTAGGAAASASTAE